MWRNDDTCWQNRLSPCFRAALEALPMLLSRHALLHPASTWEETTRCSALLCTQVSFQRNSWKISQYYNTPVSPPVCAMGPFRTAGLSVLGLRCCQDVRRGARAAELTAEHPRPAESVRTQRSCHTTRGTPHGPPSIAKWSITNYRNKNKATGNIFNAFWCDHISQLICVISLSFSLSTKPSLNCFCSCALLLNSVAFSLFYCLIYLHQPWSF